MSNIIIPVTLDLSRFRPVGKFLFSFSKKTATHANGSVSLCIRDCNITHLPFTLDDKSMKEMYKIMKQEETDVFFDGMHCYTTGNNCLTMIKHPLITEWIKNNF